MLALLAGACVASGVLLLVVYLAGPLGPITADTARASLVLFVLVWVLLDAVVRTLDQRTRPRDP